MSERYKESNSLVERALKSIPLASQTFSKSITQFPRGVSPLFIERGLGSHVWDVDGNEYIDFVNALNSVSIGYNDPDVTAGISKQLLNGVSFTLPHRLEMEVAEALIDIIPCAEMVRFGKNGTDATSAAIRLSRAYTNRDRVLVCGYHGWQDWYIGSTLRSSGVPKAVQELTHSFIYNDINSLSNLFNKFPNEIAAVIMEPMNVEWPKEGFLQAVKELTHKNGAVFIFDETITGCRFAKGGAQELFNVIPDLATFGKGLGNGLPLSAVLGKKELMMKIEDIFFSGTFGGETLSLAAAKAVINKIRNENVVERLEFIGNKVLSGVQLLIDKHGANDFIEICGHPSWTILIFQDSRQSTSWQIKTLFLQEMFKRGILIISSHNISFSHTEQDVVKLIQVYEEVFPMLVSAIKENKVAQLLEVEALMPLFKVR